MERGADSAGETELYLEEAAVVHLTPSFAQAPQPPRQIRNSDCHRLGLDHKYKNWKMHQKIAFVGPNFLQVSTRKNVNSEMTANFFLIHSHIRFTRRRKVFSLLCIWLHNRSLFFLLYLVIQALDFSGQRLAHFLLFMQ